jgi:hypothetical protein
MFKIFTIRPIVSLHYYENQLKQKEHISCHNANVGRGRALCDNWMKADVGPSALRGDDKRMVSGCVVTYCGHSG